MTKNPPAFTLSGALAKLHRNEQAGVPVTPAVSQRWIDGTRYERQRKYDENHALFLAETMKRGEFFPTMPIVFAKLGDVSYNINGRHTMHGIVKAGVTQHMTVLTVEVDNEEQIAQLYAAIDAGKPRTVNDGFAAHGLAQKFGLSASQVVKTEAGIKHINSRYSNTRAKTYEMKAPAERVRQFEKYGRAAKQFFDTVRRAPGDISGELNTGAVLSIALPTMLQSPDKAKEFWSQVAFCDGLKVGDPRKTLREWLCSNGPSLRTNPAQKCRAVAYAWEAFVQGRQTSRIKVVDWTKPVVIAKAS